MAPNPPSLVAPRRSRAPPRSASPRLGPPDGPPPPVARRRPAAPAPPPRARSRPVLGVRDRRHDHARRKGPGRQGHRRARGRSGVRALHGYCRATTAPAEGVAALLPRLQGAGGQDGTGRALSRARRGRARDSRRDSDVHGSFRQSKRHPGAMIAAGDSVTVDVTTGAILDETTGRNIGSTPVSPVVRQVIRAVGLVAE